jgi:tetratricopeptide (TPR) repeat protein
MSSQFREALDAFMQAIQHDQAEPANYYFAGFTFEAGLQNRIEALRYYRKALSLDSMDPDFYRMLAVAFDRLDERDDSNAALRKAVAVGQSSATPPSKVECGRL